jgi:hypothetical protein
MEAIDLNPSDSANKPAYPNIKSLIILFLIIVVIQLVGGAPSVLFKIYKLKSPLLKSLANLIVYVSTMLIVIKYAINKSKRQEGEHFKINFNKPPGWSLTLIIIYISALLGLLFWLSSSIPTTPLPVVHSMFKKQFSTDALSIIRIVIAAPILEEILFRGIILRGLLKGYPTYKAILISAIFFAVIHINPLQAFFAFFGGSFIGWVYYKTQSVIPGMVVHATINGTAMALFFLAKLYFAR